MSERRRDTVTGDTKLSVLWTVMAAIALWGLTSFVFYNIGQLLRGALL
jgi:hypothetical protein